MFKVGDHVRVKWIPSTKASPSFGTILDVSETTALVNFDNWGKLRVWKDRILHLTTLCA